MMLDEIHAVWQEEGPAHLPEEATSQNIAHTLRDLMTTQGTKLCPETNEEEHFSPKVSPVSEHEIKKLVILNEKG